VDLRWGAQALVVEENRAAVELDVGTGEAGRGLDVPARLVNVGRQRPASGPLEAFEVLRVMAVSSDSSSVR
jgi:hypothetical protein